MLFCCISVFSMILLVTFCTFIVHFSVICQKHPPKKHPEAQKNIGLIMDEADAEKCLPGVNYIPDAFRHPFGYIPDYSYTSPEHMLRFGSPRGVS